MDHRTNRKNHVSRPWPKSSRFGVVIIINDDDDDDDSKLKDCDLTTNCHRDMKVKANPSFLRVVRCLHCGNRSALDPSLDSATLSTEYIDVNS